MKNYPAVPDMGAIWRRGAKLGLWWTVIFFAVTGGVYALLGALGWSGAGRALCAMGAGPLLALSLIALWWLARRPTLTLLEPDGDGKSQGGEKKRSGK